MWAPALTLLCLAALVATRNPWWLLAGLLCGYGFAWIGHFGFEKNKPASFKRPLYSFMGDWVMYSDMWVQGFQAPDWRVSGPAHRSP